MNVKGNAFTLVATIVNNNGQTIVKITATKNDFIFIKDFATRSLNDRDGMLAEFKNKLRQAYDEFTETESFILASGFVRQ